MSDEEETESESGDEEEEADEDKEDEKEEEDNLESLNLGKEQIKLLRGAFTAFDHEKKGVLGMEMIGIILELLGHTLQQNELEDIINEVDADGSGELEFEEFCILASKFLPEDSEEENPEQLTVQLKEAFRFYDKGGNGYITVSDFTEMLRELDPEIPEDEIEGMVREIDQDDSGTVDFDEFMNSLI